MQLPVITPESGRSEVVVGAASLLRDKDKRHLYKVLGHLHKDVHKDLGRLYKARRRLYMVRGHLYKVREYLYKVLGHLYKFRCRLCTVRGRSSRSWDG